MNSRTIQNASDIDAFAALLRNRQLPVTVSVRKGKARSNQQNRLQQQWFADAASQLGDRSVEDVRSWAKLHLGVPILREADENFRARYDEVVKPLGYEAKLALMLEPFDFPVTRLMTSKQKTTYLDTMHRELSSMGVKLTDPEALKWEGAQ